MSEIADCTPLPVLHSARRRLVTGGAAAGVGAAVVVRYHASPSGWVAAFAAVVLVILAAIDVETRRVPNEIVLPAAAIVLVGRLILDPRWAWVAAAFGAALCFFVLALIRPGGLGMGDVKLVLLMGALLGSAVIAALLLGTLAGAAMAIVLFARRGTAAARMTIPYAPCLVLGALVALLLGRP